MGQFALVILHAILHPSCTFFAPENRTNETLTHFNYSFNFGSNA